MMKSNSSYGYMAEHAARNAPVYYVGNSDKRDNKEGSLIERLVHTAIDK